MDDLTEFAAPEPVPDAPRGGWSRFGRVAGWAVAVVAIPAGLLLTYLALSLGNCKWGLFGDTGPSSAAGTFDSGDVGAIVAGWVVAALPWAIVAFLNPRPDRRRLAVGVIVVVGVVALLLQVPHLVDPEGYWAGVCT